MSEQYQEDLHASEWIVRIIIGNSDSISYKKIHEKVIKVVEASVTHQTRDGRHFFFTVGVPTTLSEWLEYEVDNGNLLACGDGNARRFQLSDFMRGLIQEQNTSIQQLIKKATGLKQLPI